VRVDNALVLVHSPSVGPLTWAPIADRLTAQGRTAIVPALLDVADAAPPFWPRVVESVAAAVDDLPPELSIVLVAHSNAGLFVPLIVESSPRPVAGCVFVDAALPARSGPTAVVPPEMLDFLRAKITDGRLPQWTSWWDEADVAPMFPDPVTREAISAEQPRLPMSYYEQAVPVPVGWDRMPCSYLLFGPPYEEVADDARDRGWRVEQVPGEHLHQVVAPDAVTAAIVRLAAGATGAGRSEVA
jgi:pimeloyl-ACP methyl ester carboxylesterase